MKLCILVNKVVYRTNIIEIVKCSQCYLHFNLRSVMLAKRTDNFGEKFKK